jgi:hypothetical protein
LVTTILVATSSSLDLLEFCSQLLVSLFDLGPGAALGDERGAALLTLALEALVSAFSGGETSLEISGEVHQYLPIRL